MKRALIIAGVIIVLVGGGVWAYTRWRSRPAAQRGDPALATALAIRALEQGGDRRLSKDQIGQILPLLKVLRDTDPNDAEVSRALAGQVQGILTSEQRDALQRIREEARTRRQQSGQAVGPRRGPGPGGGPGVGPPGGPGSRAELRQRMLGRLIDYLEARLNSP